jgi:hypothetical protein
MDELDQQIINSLIEAYTERGVDLTSIVDDPMFKGLSLSSKISAIKSNANTIIQGTSKGFSKDELKKAGKKAAIAGGLAALFGTLGTMQAIPFFPGEFKYPVSSIAKLVGVGAAASAGISGVASFMNHGDRKSILKDLDRVKENPTDNNVLKMLINRGVYTPLQTKDPLITGLNNLSDRANALVLHDAGIYGNREAILKSDLHHGYNPYHEGQKESIDDAYKKINDAYGETQDLKNILR